MKLTHRNKFLIGIDEVGRGPIAGPVAVGAFVFLVSDAKKLFRGVKESKQLSEAQREEWFGRIKSFIVKSDQKLVTFSVCMESQKTIDTRGISFAIRKCIKKCLKNLALGHGLKPEDCLVLLDGGLEAPPEYLHQKTIIKGDAKKTVIALASICAKVLRDRKMVKWARMYPGYGFEVHKGYGTKKHYEAIRAKGLTPLHRLSFLAKKPHIS